MIALDTGDKLRAYASVADKVDYTIHGMVNDEVSQLSDGQLAGAEADIYTAPNDAGLVSTIIFVNTHTVAITCNLYLKPSGGTSRRIIPKNISIDAGSALCFDGMRLFVGEAADTVAVTSQPADIFVVEGGALGKGVLLQGDDGTDRHNIAVSTGGDLKVTLDSEDVVLGAGSAAIGDVNVLSLPNKLSTWTQVVVDIGSATTTELVAAVAGHTYTILTVSLTIAAENNLTFKSASTAKTGPMDFGKSGEAHGWQANFWPVGIKGATGEALNLTTTTAGQVSGIICVLDES
jgi:hypothetical protein